jgi:beta-galactosidase
MRASAGGAALAALSAHPGVPAPAGESRQELSFDEGWRFHRGDLDGAQAPSFDDAGWRELDIPHDWRIEDLPYAQSDEGGATADPAGFAYLKAPFPQGPPPSAIGPFDPNADLAIDTEVTVPPLGHVIIPGGRGQAYTVGDVGWYRKRFAAPARLQTRGLVELRFDGVYQNADVWLNGVHLGFHPNGYTSFAFDLTPHLKAGGDNLLAVRVENRGKTSRWYSGSGIYRHAWLTVTGPVRIPLWGVRITTPRVDENRSIAVVEVKVLNAGAPVEARVRITVLGPAGRVVAVHETQANAVTSVSQALIAAEIAIEGAALWSTETPHLYEARTEVLIGAHVVDSVTTPFGVRSLVFDGAGFRLNGKEVKIRGANIHHDHGPLGSAAIDRAVERKIEILKAAGFSAIRGAHNPSSPYLLEVCDRLGMLVYNEFSDMWDQPKMADDYHRHFPDWWERDLSSFVRRDRNHPSVILWSIGNEIFEDPNDYGPRLAALVRSLDPTRPVTQGGINVGPKGKEPWAYVDVGDFHGAPSAAVQAAHPDKAFLQSEDMAAQIFDDGALARDHPWYVGSWVWSGWDYIGEAGSGVTVVATSQGQAVQAAIDAVVGKTPYPWITNFQADIDLIGQRKPQSYWRAVVNGLSPLEMYGGAPAAARPATVRCALLLLRRAPELDLGRPAGPAHDRPGLYRRRRGLPVLGWQDAGDQAGDRGGQARRHLPGALCSGRAHRRGQPGRGGDCAQVPGDGRRARRPSPRVRRFIRDHSAWRPCPRPGRGGGRGRPARAGRRPSGGVRHAWRRRARRRGQWQSS